jgi:type IV fimbrial biogenesis protein FimT
MKSLVLCRARGFTLIELLITVALVVVLLTLGVPSMKSFFDRERLIGATEQIYSHLQQARIEAIARSSQINMDFRTDEVPWSYGFSQKPICGIADKDDPAYESEVCCDVAITNATNSRACVISVDDGENGVDPGDGTVDKNDLVLTRFDGQGTDGVRASVVGDELQLTFDYLRGAIKTLDTNTISLTSDQGRTLNIVIGALGQIRICSPDDNVAGYSEC